MNETSAGRRDFVKTAAGVAAAGCLAPLARGEERMGVLERNITRPLAITMWDFSWLERRWPGSYFWLRGPQARKNSVHSQHNATNLQEQADH